MYLTKVRYRGDKISSGETQQELGIPEKSFYYAAGLKWLTYKQLYGMYQYETSDKSKRAAYKERVKWGKKMGR